MLELVEVLRLVQIVEVVVLVEQLLAGLHEVGQRDALVHAELLKEPVNKLLILFEDASELLLVFVVEVDHLL